MKYIKLFENFSKDRINNRIAYSYNLYFCKFLSICNKMAPIMPIN